MPLLNLLLSLLLLFIPVVIRQLFTRCHGRQIILVLHVNQFQYHLRDNSYPVSDPVDPLALFYTTTERCLFIVSRNLLVLLAHLSFP